MKKNTLNYTINVLLFIDLCAISVIGVMLKFVVPSGRSSQKYFIGLHRQQWSDLHLYLSLLLLLLVILHVWFHWAWVVNSTKRYFGAGAKYFYVAILCGWVGVLFLGWAVMQW
ncbi:MAG: DUF4405 domain-containing protein [Desulfovermiculus sp.]|nr:DUF4405 domain-containing protein [Desulfovermiculus sp.]